MWVVTFGDEGIVFCQMALICLISTNYYWKAAKNEKRLIPQINSNLMIDLSYTDCQSFSMMTHDLMIARAGRSWERFTVLRGHESQFVILLSFLIRFFKTTQYFTVDECLTQKPVCCVIHQSDFWLVWSSVQWASHWRHTCISVPWY